MIEKIPNEAFEWAGGIGYLIAAILAGIDTISTYPTPYWPGSLAVLIFVASTLMLWPIARSNRITSDNNQTE